MKKCINLIVICLVFLGVATGAFGQLLQNFGLDDNPSAPFGPGAPPTPPYCSAEDEYGLNNPAFMAGLIGPSPSLATVPCLDSDVLQAGPSIALNPPRSMPPLFYVDAFSVDHSGQPETEKVNMRFSVDRATIGIAGSAVLQQANLNQQPGDIYDTDIMFTHPGNFVGLNWVGPPLYYAGVLPTAGTGNSNLLNTNQSAFGLIPANGPATMAPAINPGTHDNIDSYNDYPLPVSQMPMIYYALHPAEAAMRLASPADIFVSAPTPFAHNANPWAPSTQIGLDQFTVSASRDDSVDALVVWDVFPQGEPTGASMGSGSDYVLFSLAPDSPTLIDLNNNGILVDSGTIFFSDGSGLLAIYLWSSDLGLTPSSHGDPNVDALEAEKPEGGTPTPTPEQTPTPTPVPTPTPPFWTPTPTPTSTPTPTPGLPPLTVAINPDIHFDYSGTANDFHVEGTIHSMGTPTVVSVMIFGDPGTGNWTAAPYTLIPIGPDMYKFILDFSTDGSVVFCDWIHFGIEFQAYTHNIIVDLVGWWTLNGTPVGGSVPMTGFNVQEPPPGGGQEETGGGPGTVTITNDSTVDVVVMDYELAISFEYVPLEDMFITGLGRPGEPSPMYPGLVWVDIPGFPIDLPPGHDYVVDLAANGIVVPQGQYLLMRGKQLMEGVEPPPQSKIRGEMVEFLAGAGDGGGQVFDGDFGFFWEEHQDDPNQ